MIWLNNQNSDEPGFSFTPKTGIAFPKSGGLFFLCESFIFEIRLREGYQSFSLCSISLKGWVSYFFVPPRFIPGEATVFTLFLALFISFGGEGRAHVCVASSFSKPTAAQRCLSATGKIILEDLFSSVLSKSKNITPLEN